MFTPATKAKSKLRLAIFGPAGSGKSYTSLAIASGLISTTEGGGKIGGLDTERGSLSKYAGRLDQASGVAFTFDVAELAESKKIEDYLNVIKNATQYDVLVIDSLTHAWEELLEEIERIAQTKFRGNSWAAWQEGTPKQRKLIDAILSFPGHIIATMRSKTEWQVETDSQSGKMKPRRMGLKPEQGKSIEFEFDMLLDMTSEHYGTVIKDRTGKFQDAILEKPGVEFGKQLAAWLSEGVDKPAPVKQVDTSATQGLDSAQAEKRSSSISMPAAKATPDQVKQLNMEAKRLKITPKMVEERLSQYGVKRFGDLSRQQADTIIDYLKEQVKEKTNAKN